MFTQINTGEDFEKLVFGRTNRDPLRTKLSCRTLEDCIEAVKRIQKTELNWDPRFPWTEVADRLFRRVASRIEKNKNKVRLFNSVGTPLDFIHGADGFFELEGRILTVDLTKSRGKGKKHKADIIITASDLLSDRYYKLGDRIASLLSPA